MKSEQSRFVSLFLLVCALFLAGTVFAEELTSSSFILRNPTIDVGGGTSTSASFITRDVLGQNALGESTSTNFTLQSGFVYVNDPIFTVTAPASMTYTAAAVSTSSQSATATLAGVTVYNSRATTTAWSLSMTTTNLTFIGTSNKTSGSNNTVTIDGSYTGVSAPNTGGIYSVEITTGGAVGVAVFKWRDPAGVITTGVLTAPTVSLSSGLSANFAPATYVVGDKWIVRVDSQGYTNLTVQPATPAVTFGDTGVSAGANGSFSGTATTSSARTLMDGAANSSNGSYIQSTGFTQTVHANSLQGAFSATITLTLS